MIIILSYNYIVKIVRLFIPAGNMINHTRKIYINYIIIMHWQYNYNLLSHNPIVNAIGL